MRPLSSPHLGDWNRVCKPSWTGWGPSANTIDSCWRDPGRCLEIFFAPLCGFIRAFARIIDQHHFSLPLNHFPPFCCFKVNLTHPLHSNCKNFKSHTQNSTSYFENKTYFFNIFKYQVFASLSGSQMFVCLFFNWFLSIRIQTMSTQGV